MIPKIIYMCHKELDKIKIYSKNWEKLNPEYEIKLYDDHLCKEFLLNEYSQLHLDIFNFLEHGPIKADFWRLCILNKYGGLYIDADIKPIIPLKEYIEDDDDFVTCISYHFKKEKKSFQLNPHFILSYKDNEILKKTIQCYIRMYENKVKYKKWNWSICRLLTIEGIQEKKAQVLYLNNEKFKFIFEKNKNVCIYNGKTVFNNRYSNYRMHNFIN
jgi:mannosyltransferase OCH1-like enzyme